VSVVFWDFIPLTVNPATDEQASGLVLFSEISQHRSRTFFPAKSLG